MNWAIGPGSFVSVREMSDSHLMNALRWCRMNNVTVLLEDDELGTIVADFIKDGKPLTEWILIFETELKRRIKEKLDETTSVRSGRSRARRKELGAGWRVSAQGQQLDFSGDGPRNRSRRSISVRSELLRGDEPDWLVAMAEADMDYDS